MKDESLQLQQLVKEKLQQGVVEGNLIQKKKLQMKIGKDQKYVRNLDFFLFSTDFILEL